MVVLIRETAHRLPSSVMVFFRTSLGCIILLPFILQPVLRSGDWSSLRPRRLSIYTLRAFLGYSGMACSFYAIAHIPLADAIALNSTIPLWVVLFAGLFLGERVTPIRWSLTFVGFLGAVVILRPGFVEVSLAALLALASAAFYGGAACTTKVLSRTEPTIRLIFYMNTMFATLALGPAIYTWKTPSGWEWALVSGIALAGTCAHATLVRAIKSADASAVMPLDFLRLPLAAVAGIVLFGQSLDPWVVVGAIIVVGAAIGIIRSERTARASAIKAAPVSGAE